MKRVRVYYHTAPIRDLPSILRYGLVSRGMESPSAEWGKPGVYVWASKDDAVGVGTWETTAPGEKFAVFKVRLPKGVRPRRDPELPVGAAYIIPARIPPKNIQYLGTITFTRDQVGDIRYWGGPRKEYEIY